MLLLLLMFLLWWCQLRGACTCRVRRRRLLSRYANPSHLSSSLPPSLPPFLQSVAQNWFGESISSLYLYVVLVRTTASTVLPLPLPGKRRRENGHGKEALSTSDANKDDTTFAELKPLSSLKEPHSEFCLGPVQEKKKWLIIRISTSGPKSSHAERAI